NYTQNNFMLELLPIGNSSGNMKFSWLLEGLDANWSRPSELHFINYTNLPGGNFKLHIRMYDSSLSQMIDERSLNIHVTPPFWKTWWFAAIISLCTICYIIYAFKSYSNRLKRKSTNDRLIADAVQALMQERMAQAEPGIREELPVPQSKPSDPFVSRAISIINENISNSEFGKEEFAAAMNVSSSLLYKKIKTLTDQSPSDFIKTVRMNHALKLLQSGQYTVTEVSELSGFSSLSIFSRAFKSYFGKTPTEI
ncbi:helix-turn-helix domain-containing protein, partial [Bacteroides cellulosilyticus]